jgi:ribosome-binding ATPase YchF (GTP1/OBG family)
MDYKKGMNAPRLPGIYSILRGFIRSEIVKYKDFVTLGSEYACKEGKFHIEGKIILWRRRHSVYQV